MDQKAQALVESMKEQGLKDLKVLVSNQVTIALDPAVAIMVEKLKAIIPGTWDDGFIDIIVKNGLPILKEELKKQLEKIGQEPAPELPAPQA